MKRSTSILLLLLALFASASNVAMADPPSSSPSRNNKFCDSRQGWISMKYRYPGSIHELNTAIVAAAASKIGSACAQIKTSVDDVCYRVNNTDIGDTAEVFTFDYQFKGEVKTKCTIFRRTVVKDFAFTGTAQSTKSCNYCADNSYEYKPCTPVTTPYCKACSTRCRPGYYISAECGTFEDLTCTRCRTPTCTTNQFSTPCSGTGTTDRVCEDCLLSCQTGEFIKEKCSATKQTQCATCGTWDSLSCSASQYATPCDGTNVAPAACNNCTEPGSNEYLVAACTKDSDAVVAQCSSLAATDCSAGTTFFEACDATHDARCTACSTLVPADCAAGTFFEACTQQRDAQCTTCSECPTGTYIATACNSQADAVCTTCSTDADLGCTANGQAFVPCTANADSTCQPL